MINTTRRWHQDILIYEHVPTNFNWDEFLLYCEILFIIDGFCVGKPDAQNTALSPPPFYLASELKPPRPTELSAWAIPPGDDIKISWFMDTVRTNFNWDEFFLCCVICFIRNGFWVGQFRAQNTELSPPPSTANANFYIGNTTRRWHLSMLIYKHCANQFQLRWVFFVLCYSFHSRWVLRRIATCPKYWAVTTALLSC